MPGALQSQMVPVAGVGGVVLQEFAQVTWKTFGWVTGGPGTHRSFPESEQEDLSLPRKGLAGQEDVAGDGTPHQAWSWAEGENVTLPAWAGRLGPCRPVGRLGGF